MKPLNVLTILLAAYASHNMALASDVSCEEFVRVKASENSYLGAKLNTVRAKYILDLKAELSHNNMEGTYSRKTKKFVEDMIETPFPGITEITPTIENTVYTFLKDNMSDIYNNGIADDLCTYRKNGTIKGVIKKEDFKGYVLTKLIENGFLDLPVLSEKQMNSCQVTYLRGHIDNEVTEGNASSALKIGAGIGAGAVAIGALPILAPISLYALAVGADNYDGSISRTYKRFVLADYDEATLAEQKDFDKLVEKILEDHLGYQRERNPEYKHGKDWGQSIGSFLTRKVSNKKLKVFRERGSEELAAAKEEVLAWINKTLKENFEIGGDFCREDLYSPRAIRDYLYDNAEFYNWQAVNPNRRIVEVVEAEAEEVVEAPEIIESEEVIKAPEVNETEEVIVVPEVIETEEVIVVPEVIETEEVIVAPEVVETEEVIEDTFPPEVSFPNPTSYPNEVEERVNPYITDLD